MITLFLGGARSGKSVMAEQMVAGLPAPVIYLATAVVGDPDHAERVAAHRARRDPSWVTIEAAADLAARVCEVDGSVLIDSLGAWVAAAPEFAVDLTGLCRALTARAGDTVVVSEEVGLGVHPSSAAGRRFRDALGQVNSAVAEVSDEVFLVVAGRVLPLGRPR